MGDTPFYFGEGRQRQARAQDCGYESKERGQEVSAMHGERLGFIEKEKCVSGKFSQIKFIPFDLFSQTLEVHFSVFICHEIRVLRYRIDDKLIYRL